MLNRCCPIRQTFPFLSWQESIALAGRQTDTPNMINQKFLKTSFKIVFNMFPWMFIQNLDKLCPLVQHLCLILDRATNKSINAHTDSQTGMWNTSKFVAPVLNMFHTVYLIDTQKMVLLSSASRSNLT